MNTKPMYREDIKGQVKVFIQEFKDSYSGEVGTSRHDDITGEIRLAFDFGDTDDIRETESYCRYSKYLTDAEMVRAAKSAKP